MPRRAGSSPIRWRTRVSVPKALESAGGAAFDFVVAVPDGATVARTLNGVTTPQTVVGNAALIAATPFGGAPGVVLVVPKDEVAAVEWMSANREKIAELAHVTEIPSVESTFSTPFWSPSSR